MPRWRCDAVQYKKGGDPARAALVDGGGFPRYGDEQGGRRGGDLLPISTQDLLHLNVGDEGYFMHKQRKPSQYHGVLGAILPQSKVRPGQQTEDLCDALDKQRNMSERKSGDT